MCIRVLSRCEHPGSHSFPFIRVHSRLKTADPCPSVFIRGSYSWVPLIIGTRVGRIPEFRIFVTLLIQPMRTLVLGTVAVIGAVAAQAQKTYSFTSIPGDPLQARIYTLDNGLQVWLSRNTDAPRIQTNIAVRAGSKNDPSDATGLAHYLEHMLFKGTSRIGTKDWAAESAVLKQISDAYEERRKTTDPAERDRIYRRIDSLSTVAAGFSVPNEYDKMIKSLGARGTNAYTSTERTVYINDIPSDELERWIKRGDIVELEVEGIGVLRNVVS